jgi:hypothetical protein
LEEIGKFPAPEPWQKSLIEQQSRESDEVLGMFLGIDTTNPQSRGNFKSKSQ